jgi:ankyrin repeat protein
MYRTIANFLPKQRKFFSQVKLILSHTHFGIRSINHSLGGSIMSNNRSLQKRSLSLTSLFACTVLFSHVCIANIQSETAYTPDILLQNAIKAGQLDDVRTLISDERVDVNRPFSDGITPLHASVINNQENIAIVLVEAGAKTDAPDPTTQATALHLASLYGREKIAAYLIQKGANVNADMKFGITPLLVATQFNQPQIVQLLLDKKANINHTDQEGFTALHFAAQNGNEIITNMLLDHGAKMNVNDKTTKATPLEIAIENNHPEVARVLEEHGAR